MGSLHMAGALTGLGQGMVVNAEEKRKAQESENERMHDMQLENMRQKHQRELQSERITAQEKSDKSRMEFEAMSQDVAQKFEGGEAGKDRQLTADVERWKGEVSMFNTMLSQYYSAKGRVGSTNKVGDWEVTFQDAGIDENGQIIQKMFASNPNTGTSVEQIGERMIPANLPPKEREEALRPWANPAKGHEAETKLLRELAKGNDTSEMFLESFDYLPASYYRAKAEQTLPGFAEFAMRMPAFGVGGSGKVVGGALSNAAAATGETPPTAQPAPIPTPVQPEDLTQGGQLEPMQEITGHARGRQPAPLPRPAPTPTPSARSGGVLQQMYDQSPVAQGIATGAGRVRRMPPPQAPRNTRAGSQQ